MVDFPFVPVTPRKRGYGTGYREGIVQYAVGKFKLADNRDPLLACPCQLRHIRGNPWAHYNHVRRHKDIIRM